MKTRYSSLVALKKNQMQKSERAVQEANRNLTNARDALQQALLDLQSIQPAAAGKIAEFLANRTLIDAQLRIIDEKRQWLAFAQNALKEAQALLKKDMIEFEKFKYLEYQEIEKILKAKKLKEAKDLDEIALLTFGKKTPNKDANQCAY